MPIQTVKPGVSRRRMQRSPQFDCTGSLKPHALQLLLALPVLPGETLTRIRAKLRVMSHPVKSPLAGAHYEMAAFYVKLTDINEGYKDFFVPEEADPSVPTSSISRPYLGYDHTMGPPWISNAYERIVSHYFTDAGEEYDDPGRRFGAAATGPIVVKRDNKSWFNNLNLQFSEATMGTDAGEAGKEISAADAYRLMMMEETKYEDYLEQYGVSVPPQALDQPEMFYYSRSWSLPRNSVEPTTGVPASSWAWQPAVDMQKRIRFSEPGFVLLLHWVRPKLYLEGVKSLIHTFNDPAVDWLPPFDLSNPLSGAAKTTFSALPLDSSLRTDAGDQDLIYDRHDLWVHGEQWRVDYEATPGAYAAPGHSPSFNDADSDQIRRGQYPTEAEIDALFTGTTADTELVEYDGLAVVDINGHVVDDIQ